MRLIRLLIPVLAMAFAVAWATVVGVRPVPDSLSSVGANARKVRVVDRRGIPLSITFVNSWNVNDCVPLHEVPRILQQAFIESEDRRFFEHHGVDWLGRAHALAQNIRALRVVRGASTITEQVVRMLHPRPRTVWSRWLEGIEASLLEARFSKAEILEFYLNQVPYAHQRRGVAQAASFYFDRDLNTLTTREMLALAVLVRAPSAMDLRHRSKPLQRGVVRLAARMRERNFITDEEYRRAAAGGGWSLAEPRIPVEAGHFVHHLYRTSLSASAIPGGKLVSTLDASLQHRVQQILDSRLGDLCGKRVSDGAVLVVDHTTDEVLAWVNGGGLSAERPGGWIDAVTTPRQPGSTLKPFLYALAIEMGWNAATVIDDSPLAEPVGSGLHSFHNYSRIHYGPLRLREALGNSLNIPAVHTVRFTGTTRFLDSLHALGFTSLDRPPDQYGEGIVLGNGEVTLLELVRAYTVLARGGEYHPLRTTLRGTTPQGLSVRVFTEETTSVVADILSDPQARRLEFGDGCLLRLPVQTAVKTGTSNDHRDAWTVGFSHRYTVGVWMGNLDRSPTDGVTGTAGPGLVLRSVFAELNRCDTPQPLRISPALIPAVICPTSGLRAESRCPTMQEWFRSDEAPQTPCPLHTESLSTVPRPRPVPPPLPDSLHLLQPTPGLELAMDPHIPDHLEAFAFLISKEIPIERVEWLVNGTVAGVTAGDGHRFLWPVSRGVHLAKARVWSPGAAEPKETPPVRFVVR